MKRRFAHFLLVLLCLALLLSACSGDTPEQHKTADENSVMLPQEYETIIRNIMNSHPWNDDDQSPVPENPELSYMYRRSAELSDIGFALVDLDNNGQKELLISDVHQDYVYDLYTISNGQAVHLLSSGERSCYYVRENGFFEHQWSGGAGLSGHDFYKLENGSMGFVERITIDAQHAMDLGIIEDISDANEVDTYFKSQSTRKEDYQPITSTEAESAIDAYKDANKPLTLDFTLLSEWNP